jgi:4-hydroxybenzoate polyprenyltransferase
MAHESELADGAAAGAATSGRRSRLRAYASCIRYREVLLLQGSPLLGAAFGIDHLDSSGIFRLLALAAASFLLVAHVFTLNDWAGRGRDSNDPNKKQGPPTGDVTSPELATLSFVLLAVSLLLFTLLPQRTLVLAAAIAVLGIIYSHPLTHGKGIPLFSSALHLAGGTLHFLLGYSVFAAPDGRAMLVALFFALTFAAGHLNQEVQDHDGDRANGWTTNSVRFGKQKAFRFGFVLFSAAYATLLMLACAGYVPSALGWLALTLYAAHAFFSAAALRDGLDFQSMVRLRARYRALYAILGVAMTVRLLARP